MSSLAVSGAEKVSIAEWPINPKLTQGTIISVLRARDGMLWIATLDGVSRFDGNEVFNFRSHHDSEGFIESSKISSIIEGHNGQIYAATIDSGLLVYSGFNDSFERLHCCKSNEQFDETLSAAFADKKGRIWLGHSNGSISVYLPSTQSVKTFGNVSGSKITSFSEDSSGVLVVGSSNGSIFLYKNNSASFEQVPFSKQCIYQFAGLKRIAIIDPNSAWVGTGGNGLYKVSLQNGECRKFSLNKGIQASSGKVNIHAILYDNITETTLVGTDQGLYVIDGSRITNHSHIGNSKLANNEVTSFSLDWSGAYWVGTFTGLNYLIPTSIESYTDSNLESLHSIVAIEDSYLRGIWIASYNGILHFDPIRRIHLELETVYPNLTMINRKVMTINTDKHGLWVGYRSSGLELYSSKDGITVSFNSSTQPRLSSNAISALLTASSGEIFIGTHGSGLNILSSDLKTTRLLLEARNILMLYETKDRLIWIGTQSGLYRLDLRSETAAPEKVDLIVDSNQVSPTIWSMSESITGDIWLGTMHDGLYFWSRDSNSSSPRPQKFSLGSSDLISSIYAIEIDNNGHVWCSTNQGIVRVDPSNESTSLVSTHHGVNFSEFDFGVSNKDSEGRLYFGGSEGYIRFDPSDVKIDPNIPIVRLTEVISTDSFPTTSGFVDEAKPIELNHKNYFITFTFSVLDFLDPEKNRFRYKLVNFDPDWIDNGTRNTATYTNLPPGQYTLRVQGANSSGVWNREGISLDVIVLPPPWRSWWAYCLYGLLALALFWFMKRTYDSYSIERRAKQLAIEMHDAEMRADDDIQEQLELQDEMIKSSYQHNVATLSLINDFISCQGDYVPDEAYREAVDGNVRKIEALSKLESCVYYQNDGLLVDLNKYANLITSQLIEDAAVKPESISTINDITRTLIPAEIASPMAIILAELIENCTQHAFVAESLANYIQISLEVDRPSGARVTNYRLIVSDNGVGIPQSIQNGSAETPGFAIIQSIIDRLSGTIKISSNNGSVVTVEITSGG